MIARDSVDTLVCPPNCVLFSLRFSLLLARKTMAQSANSMSASDVLVGLLETDFSQFQPVQVTDVDRYEEVQLFEQETY